MHNHQIAKLHARAKGWDKASIDDIVMGLCVVIAALAFSCAFIIAASY